MDPQEPKNSQPNNDLKSQEKEPKQRTPNLDRTELTEEFRWVMDPTEIYYVGMRANIKLHRMEKMMATNKFHNLPMEEKDLIRREYEYLFNYYSVLKRRLKYYETERVY